MAHSVEQLVGRDAELEVLERSLAGLERRRSCAVELLGEPGIGKTRMLAELGQRADARGHIVLAGSASELERELPFSVFVDALDDSVQEALDGGAFTLPPVLPREQVAAAARLEAADHPIFAMRLAATPPAEIASPLRMSRAELNAILARLRAVPAA